MNSLSPEPLYYDVLKSQIGLVVIAISSAGIRHIAFQDGPKMATLPDHWKHDMARLAKPIQQIKEYFAGRLEQFELPLAPVGTEFQLSVWKALRTIPYGETITYGELAQKVGKPKASRAVGNANGKNPIVIIQPCHRVVAAGGKLGGFSSGLHRKKYLLRLEKRIPSLFSP